MEGINIIFLPDRLEFLDEQLSPSGTGKIDMSIALRVAYFIPVMP